MPRKAADEPCIHAKSVRTTQSVLDRIEALVDHARTHGDDIDRGHDGSHAMTASYLMHCIIEDFLGTRKNGALKWVASVDKEIIIDLHERGVI